MTPRSSINHLGMSLEVLGMILDMKKDHASHGGPRELSLRCGQPQGDTFSPMGWPHGSRVAVFIGLRVTRVRPHFQACATTLSLFINWMLF